MRTKKMVVMCKQNPSGVQPQALHFHCDVSNLIKRNEDP